MKKILAFETSCDDTAVAIVDEMGKIYGEAIFSQLEVHEPYLGVVPEIGSRAHIEQITKVTNEAFDKAGLRRIDIDAVAATFAPGLLGPLLVGAQFAKGVAMALGVPLIAVHHIEGHIFSGFRDEGFFEPPFLALVVSGGHTSLYRCDENYRVALVGQTLDDAAGEAFDKIGRAMGLGYPAGKRMDELARNGNSQRFSLPVAMRNSQAFNFSFSGLKTSALNGIVQNAPMDDQSVSDLCAGVQEAIAQALCEKTIRAAKSLNVDRVVTGGGVMANSRVRQMLKTACEENGIGLYLPKVRYCTDNAVMIAKVGHIKLSLNQTSSYRVDPCASLPIEEAFSLVS